MRNIKSSKVEDTIESVIPQYRLPDDENSFDEETATENNTPLLWRNVDGSNLRN